MSSEEGRKPKLDETTCETSHRSGGFITGETWGVSSLDETVIDSAAAGKFVVAIPQITDLFDAVVALPDVIAYGPASMTR